MSDWIKWEGGECPVKPEQIITCQTRSGSNVTVRAMGVRWSYTGSSDDVVAYRLISPIRSQDPDYYFHVQQKKEMVNHPDHYGGGDNPYEAIKVIEAWSLNFSLGSAVKYISRWNKKGAGIEDLKKARRYLDFEIARLEREKVKYLAGEIGDHYKEGAKLG